MEDTITLLLYFVLSAVGTFFVFSIAVMIESIVFKHKVSTTIGIMMLLFGVSLIGASAGFSGGMSRTGVVGTIIPAMFTLLGGLAIYLFGVDTTRGTIASFTGACLATSLFVSYAVASQLRNTEDEHRDLRSFCVKAYSDGNIIGKPEALAAFESKFGNFCTARGMKWNLP